MKAAPHATPVAKTLGMQLKEYREAKDFTRRQLAEVLWFQLDESPLDVDSIENALAHLESDRYATHLGNLERIASALGYQFERIQVPFDVAMNFGVPFRFI
jgi:transcriptional regulator with XRE-family HTH domain